MTRKQHTRRRLRPSRTRITRRLTFGAKRLPQRGWSLRLVGGRTPPGLARPATAPAALSSPLLGLHLPNAASNSSGSTSSLTRLSSSSSSIRPEGLRNSNSNNSSSHSSNNASYIDSDEEDEDVWIVNTNIWNAPAVGNLEGRIENRAAMAAFNKPTTRSRQTKRRARTATRRRRHQRKR